LQNEADYKVVEKTLEKVKTGFDGQVRCELGSALSWHCWLHWQQAAV
jgi:hypothetical protein